MHLPISSIKRKPLPYDRINWDFLGLTLTEFGFSPLIINLLMSCVTSFSFLLNGMVQNFIVSNQIRVYDKESTITLFICSLHGEIVSDDTKQVTNNTLRPTKISREGPSFSHLLFADDCLLFTEANSSQVKLVKDVLQKFCFVS